MSGVTPFFVWYDVQNENTATKVYETVPSKAARQFHKDSRYKLSDTIMVRNIEGRPFRYTLEQLEEAQRKKATG